MLGNVWIKEIVQAVPREIDVGKLFAPCLILGYDAEKRMEVVCADNESASDSVLD